MGVNGFMLNVDNWCGIILHFSVDVVFICFCSLLGLFVVVVIVFCLILSFGILLLVYCCVDVGESPN